MLTSRRAALLLGFILLISCLYLFYYEPSIARSQLRSAQAAARASDREALMRAVPEKDYGDWATLFAPGTLKPPGSTYTKTLVIPHTKEEDIQWIHDELPDIDLAVYEMDDPTAPLHPPVNKGRESMAYLSYIIDHYDKLPDVVLFFHAHRGAWHNNILLDLNSATMIKRLRPEHVVRTGYMPARCHLDYGCPDWIQLARPEVDFDSRAKPEEKSYTIEVWKQLHPGELVPHALSQPCCAQFAVSRERILANPIQRYIHYRSWLIQTELDDQTSGRIFEYTWQYIFTRQHQYCPETHVCYCSGYGICFGSHKDLQMWMDKMDRRWKLQDLLGKEESKSADAIDTKRAEELKNEIDELVRQLDGEKEAAYQRGEYENNRRVEEERLG